MTLQECIQRIGEVKECWPNGLNFKNKSRFRGFSLGDVCLSIEEMESNKWSIEFESLDKEFNKALNGFFDNQKEQGGMSIIIFNRRIQFIWWGYWIGIRFHKWKDSYNYRILDFSLNCGFFEIRFWLKGAH